MTVRNARFPAIDVMRGLVMVLMTIDHASETFNHGRVFTDSVMFWKPGGALARTARTRRRIRRAWRGSSDGQS